MTFHEYVPLLFRSFVVSLFCFVSAVFSFFLVFTRVETTPLLVFYRFHYHYDETSASPLSDVKPEADDFPFNLSRDPERPHWVWGRVERWDGEERERERITKGW